MDHLRKGLFFQITGELGVPSGTFYMFFTFKLAWISTSCGGPFWYRYLKHLLFCSYPWLSLNYAICSHERAGCVLVGCLRIDVVNRRNFCPYYVRYMSGTCFCLNCREIGCVGCFWVFSAWQFKKRLVVLEWFFVRRLSRLADRRRLPFSIQQKLAALAMDSPNGFADQTIPFLNGYFIGKINPTFSDKPN